MGDKYDEAIEYLVENPDEAEFLWGSGDDGIPGSPLFQYCSPTGGDDGFPCGCLTQIRCTRRNDSVRLRAHTDDLTEEISADERIHEGVILLRIALEATDDPEERRRILQPYAEWQRRLDKEIRNVPAGA